MIKPKLSSSPCFLPHCVASAAIAAAFLLPLPAVVAADARPPMTMGKARLGGDVEIHRRQKPLNYAMQAYLLFTSKTVSRVRTMEAHAQHKEKNLPILLKSVDRSYPLYGRLELALQQEKKPLARIAHRAMWGAVVNQALLDGLGITIGQRFQVGKAQLVATALLAGEPDLPPDSPPQAARVLVGKQAFDLAAKAGGPPIDFYYRLKLSETVSPAGWKAAFEKRFPDGNWTIRDWKSPIDKPVPYAPKQDSPAGR